MPLTRVILRCRMSTVHSRRDDVLLRQT